MAQCNKSWGELAFALTVLIFIAASTGLSVLGTYWNQYNITSKYITGNTYIIIGNVMSVFASFAAIAIMAKAFVTSPVPAGIIAILIFIGIVVDLYITMFAETSVVGDAFAYTLLGFNALPKFTAVLLGYGICDIPGLLGAARILAGKRR